MFILTEFNQAWLINYLVIMVQIFVLSLNKTALLSFDQTKNRPIWVSFSSRHCSSVQGLRMRIASTATNTMPVAKKRNRNECSTANHELHVPPTFLQLARRIFGKARLNFYSSVLLSLQRKPHLLKAVWHPSLSKERYLFTVCFVSPKVI